MRSRRSIRINLITSGDPAMTLQRTIIIAMASAALSLSGVVAAVAHAHLVRATPAEGGTVKSAPNEVTLKFNEKLEAAFSSAACGSCGPFRGRASPRSGTVG